MVPNDGRVVSNFIIQALRNDDITVFGDGSQTRSFCYVTDLIRGMIAMMNSSDEYTGPVNLGNPYEITIKQMAEEIIRITYSKSKIINVKLPKDDPVRRKPDITKARKVLNWDPVVSLEDGLRETVEYFRRRIFK
jgi:UDP-glucuronate decarboxylase